MIFLKIKEFPDEGREIYGTDIWWRKSGDEHTRLPYGLGGSRQGCTPKINIPVTLIANEGSQSNDGVKKTNHLDSSFVQNDSIKTFMLAF